MIYIKKERCEMKAGRKPAVLFLAFMLTAVTLLAGCGGASDEAKWEAMDSLKATEAADITRIDFQRATEGGAYGNSVYDLATIEDIYLRLKDVEIKSPTDAAVEDDGLSLSVKAGDSEMNFAFEGDILVLDDGKRYEVEGLDSLKSYIDRLAEEMGDAGTSGGTGSGAASSDYDITKGMMQQASDDGSIEYMYFNDFMLIMPNDSRWGWEQTDKDTVTFFLFAAKQEGYGGHLVTIKAYDLDDNSYESLPSYHVAGVGKNVNKRFIAIYPTDVQWNGQDAQQDADYRDLSSYLQKIGEGAVNSPLQTADSD